MNTRTMTVMTTAWLTLATATGAATGQAIDAALYVQQRAVYADIDQPATQALRAELAREVERMLAAGEALAPIRFERGIGGAAVLWGNPAETACTLCEAADLLPPELREQALQQARTLVAKYPPWEVGWSADGARREFYPMPDDLVPRGPADGAPQHERQRFARPELGNLYFLWRYADATGDWETIERNWRPISVFWGRAAQPPRAAEVQLVDWQLPAAGDEAPGEVRIPGVVDIQPGSLVITVTAGGNTVETIQDDGQGALKGSAGSTGGIDYREGTLTLRPSAAATGDLRASLRCQVRGRRTYGDVAGMIGYARLARQLAERDPQAYGADARRAETAAGAVIGEVADLGYPAMYRMAWALFGQKGQHDWMYPPFHLRRDNDFTTSCLFCPELGRLLRDTSLEAVREHLASYEQRANTRAWFLSYGDQIRDSVNTSVSLAGGGGEGTGGENSFMPPEFGWTIYMLQAYVLQAPPEQLRLWIDIPWAIGDLYHVQRLVAAVRAHGREVWQ